MKSPGTESIDTLMLGAYTRRMRRHRRRKAGERGQNTVEYMLMLSVVVGEILVFQQLMVNFMPKVFDQIQMMIVGTLP